MTTLNLSSAYTVKQAVTTDTIKVIQVTEDFENNIVSALVRTSEDPMINEWVTVWDSETYDIDWTQEGLETKLAEIFNGSASIDA